MRFDHHDHVSDRWVQVLLTQATTHLQSSTSLSDQLCCLEIWQLWLTRTAELRDAAEDSVAPNGEAFEGQLAPYKESIATLCELLLPVIIGVRAKKSIKRCLQHLCLCNALWLVDEAGSLSVLTLLHSCLLRANFGNPHESLDAYTRLHVSGCIAPYAGPARRVHQVACLQPRATQWRRSRSASGHACHVVRCCRRR